MVVGVIVFVGVGVTDGVVVGVDVSDGMGKHKVYSPLRRLPMSPTTDGTGGYSSVPISALVYPGGQTAGVPGTPRGPVCPSKVTAASVSGLLLTRSALDAVNANELVLGIPKGKKTATNNSVYNEINAKLAVTTPAPPTGPCKLSACAANAAVTGVFVDVSVILAEIVNELLTGLPSGIN